MNDEQRLQLRFGPYQTPKFKYGDIAQCEVRGDVTIVGMTDGLNACIPPWFCLRTDAVARTRAETSQMSWQIALPEEIETLPLDQIEVNSYVGGLVQSFERKAA